MSSCCNALRKKNPLGLAWGMYSTSFDTTESHGVWGAGFRLALPTDIWSRDALQAAMYCAALPQDATSLAIVGNGPLTPADRHDIHNVPHRAIIRFNALNNR